MRLALPWVGGTAVSKVGSHSAHQGAVAVIKHEGDRWRQRGRVQCLWEGLTEQVLHRQARGRPETRERIPVTGAVLGAHAHLGVAPASTGQARTPPCIRDWTPIGEEDEWPERVFERITSQRFQNYMKTIRSQVQEAHCIPCTRPVKQMTQRHIKTKVLKSRDQRNTLKATRKGQGHSQ